MTRYNFKIKNQILNTKMTYQNFKIKSNVISFLGNFEFCILNFNFALI